ncbi:MAG TPA: HAD family phosphatase [Mycobacterium sp.]|nr:HAD family phosphatase [Mycobacterium sp.]
MDSPTGVELVLFDLGGVLIEVPGVEAMIGLTGIDSPAEIWRRWLSCRWVRLFESGGCSETDFAAGLIEDWQLPISEGDLLESFGSWASKPIAGAEDLVAETAAAVPVGCLSNTNALHWEQQLGRWPMMELFGHTFLSFRTGFVKPDRQAFDHVVSAAGIEADRILFLDDNLINVEAACQAGIRAVHAVGVEDARVHLVDAGVLPPRHPVL